MNHFHVEQDQEALGQLSSVSGACRAGATLSQGRIESGSEFNVGYSHAQYGASFQQFGELRRLPRSEGLILIRQIPEAPQYRDAVGLYPIICCKNWQELAADISALGEEVVTLSVVTDPFGSYDENLLRSCFHVVRPFKSHFVTDFQHPLNSFLSRHHRRHARNALSEMTVEILDGPQVCAREWDALYENLAKRHGIKGIRRFSEEAFMHQLQTPGALVFRAVVGGKAVGIDIWYVENEVAYNHLVAVSDLGYQLHANYALQMTALEYLKDRVRFASFGGVAGLDGETQDGLYRFKRGWTNSTRLTYFCGSILNTAVYAELCSSCTPCNSDFFPAYRRDGYT
jgi:hypothetical protein